MYSDCSINIQLFATQCFSYQQCMLVQLQQACLLAELLLAVLLQHFAETGGDPTALSRLGDNRVST